MCQRHLAASFYNCIDFVGEHCKNLFGMTTPTSYPQEQTCHATCKGGGRCHVGRLFSRGGTLVPLVNWQGLVHRLHLRDWALKVQDLKDRHVDASKIGFRVKFLEEIVTLVVFLCLGILICADLLLILLTFADKVSAAFNSFTICEKMNCGKAFLISSVSHPSLVPRC